MPNNNEQDRENRRIAYSLAKNILKDETASVNQILECLNALPQSGNKALALRVRLQRKLEGLSHTWEV